MLNEIFTYADSITVSADEEVLLIEAAQGGDAEAYMQLLRLYGRTIRATVNAAKKTVDPEEAQGVALVAFAEVLSSHDPHDPNYRDGRLAPRLTPHLRDALGIAMAAEHAFAVPKRTYVRYIGILNEADGDVHAARTLASDRGMAVDTFDAIHAAVGADSLDEEGTSEGGRAEAAAPVYTSAPVVDVEDRILVDMAFTAVDDEAARIVGLAYGFTEYDPVPDAEIAHKMGLSRPTVQRKRGKALASMRKALGVTLEV